MAWLSRLVDVQGEVLALCFVPDYAVMRCSEFTDQTGLQPAMLPNCSGDVM